MERGFRAVTLSVWSTGLCGSVNCFVRSHLLQVHGKVHLDMKSKHLETFIAICNCSDIQETLRFSSNLLLFYCNKTLEMKPKEQKSKTGVSPPDSLRSNWLKTIGNPLPFQV